MQSSGGPLRWTGYECFAHVYGVSVIGSELVVYSAYKFVALTVDNIQRRTETLNPPPRPLPPLGTSRKSTDPVSEVIKFYRHIQMRIRRHSSPSSPSIARRLIASNPWLSVLTSAISKGSKSIQTSLPNPSLSSLSKGWRSSQTSLHNPSLSSIPPCEPPQPPPPPERSETRESPKKVSCEERSRGRSFSLTSSTDH
jgi:hypothetical protein